MGILNVTPDSFSDGGLYLDPSLALQRVQQMCEEGADIIDIGAESSRPGADFVSVDEEWKRLEPILSRMSKESLSAHISVDTNKPEIMKRLNDFGVSMVNDIKGGADRETLELLADQGLTYVAMHMHKQPDKMQMQPLLGVEAVEDVKSFYKETLEKLKAAGFSENKIWLDPGIGFGKDDAANLKLIQHSLQTSLKWNLLLGISRKSFMGRLLSVDDPVDRDPPSKMLEACFLMMGVKCIRTHDVKSLFQIREKIFS